MSSPSPNLPKPNFLSNHTVTLPLPLHQTLSILGTSEGHERICRLCKVVTGVVLLQQDTVYTGPGGLGDGTRFRTLDPSAAPALAAGDNRDHGFGGKKVHRQHFTMTETVPLLFGLIKSHVRLTGTYCWAEFEEGATSAYTVHETIADGVGITIWKLRLLEEVEVDPGEGQEKVKGTRVTERIEGWAPAWARPISQYVCASVHREQMEKFHTLFPKDSGHVES